MSADRVWLNNGDRLSDDILPPRTRYAGQVPTDWKDIDTWRADKPPVAAAHRGDPPDRAAGQYQPPPVAIVRAGANP